MREGSSSPASAYARRNKLSQRWEEKMEVTRGISIGGRETIRCSSVTQKHICLNRVRVRLTYTHTEMHGQHDIYKHCCELEEMRKRKVCSETQASRLAGWHAAERTGEGQQRERRSVPYAHQASLVCFTLCSPNPPLLQALLRMHARTLHTRLHLMAPELKGRGDNLSVHNELGKPPLLQQPQSRGGGEAKEPWARSAAPEGCLQHPQTTTLSRVPPPQLL